MKEATGELNMTIVIVIAVASLTLFFYTVIWPAIKTNMNSNVSCSKAICESKPNDDGTVNCRLEDGGNVSYFTCVWKG